MNKTEARYGQFLSLLPEVEWQDFESLSFVLGKGSRYTPDFVWLATEGTLYADDVKGAKKGGGPYYKEASLVRMKVAATRFPWVVFRMVWPTARGGWEARVIAPHG